MTGGIADRLTAACAAVTGQAAPGEEIEVFAKRTRTWLTRAAAPPEADMRDDQIGDNWLIMVSSAADGSCGQAATTAADKASLDQAVAMARQVRRSAPQPWQRVAARPEHAGLTAARPGTGTRSALTRLRAIAEEAICHSRLTTPAAVTVGHTYRKVMLADATGWSAGYSQSEAQLHARSAAPGLDGVQAARIRREPEEISVGEVAQDYARALAHLAGPACGPVKLAWLALSPLVTARMLSRLSLGLNAAAGSHLLRGRCGPARLGSAAVTLVDDGTPSGGPCGAPFDDEGTPRQRTVLIAEGVVTALLGAAGDAHPTGNAWSGGWQGGITVRPTNCFLAPTAPALQPDWHQLPGAGLVAEDLRGFRSGLDLLSTRIEFEVSGGVLRSGEYLGSARMPVSATPQGFLGALRAVHAGTEFYRVGGLFGGSWCLLDGSVLDG